MVGPPLRFWTKVANPKSWEEDEREEKEDIIYTDTRSNYKILVLLFDY